MRHVVVALGTVLLLLAVAAGCGAGAPVGSPTARTSAAVPVAAPAPVATAAATAAAASAPSPAASAPAAAAPPVPGTAAPPVPSAAWTGPPLPLLPLALAVATADGAGVVSDAWIDQEISEAQRLLGPHGVRITAVERRSLPERYRQLDTRAERDELAAHCRRGVINVFFVAALRNVDLPERFIQGVRWQPQREGQKSYVIVSSVATPTTLAHELGHFFGNPHSQVDNNIMSYRRSDPSVVAFDERQGRKMRSMVQWYVRTKEIVPLSEPAAPAPVPDNGT
ncbi:MAG: hypothetical protein HY744_14595 [Deltaproteobacteria bacterium]|nr:hypothetical protein [Deltaproteobacteria bacterium]